MSQNRAGDVVDRQEVRRQRKAFDIHVMDKNLLIEFEMAPLGFDIDVALEKNQAIVEQLTQTILKIKAQGVSLILSEQNLNFAKNVCDRAYIIQQGRICHESAIGELSPEILEKYLSV